jgi:hypothetical protein
MPGEIFEIEKFIPTNKEKTRCRMQIQRAITGGDGIPQRLVQSHFE